MKTPPIDPVAELRDVAAKLRGSDGRPWTQADHDAYRRVMGEALKPVPDQILRDWLAASQRMLDYMPEPAAI